MTSAAYEIARKAKESLMAGAVTIRFPAFGALPAKTLRFGTMRFESYDEEFVSALKDMPQTRGQRGNGQDFSDFAVNDPQMKWYEQILPYEPVFEDSSVTVKECLFTKDNIFESEIVLEGFIEKFSLNESDMTLRFTALSDMSRTGFKAGGRILSQRYCTAVFPIGGAVDPETDPCGWIPELGGNPLGCTHRLRGPGGCIDHNNSQRIVAVEGLTTADIQIVTSGSGFDYGTNPCFGIETLVWMADGSYRPIWKIKKGDLVWSFTPEGEIVRARVKQRLSHWTDETLLQNYGNERFLETTDQHFFLVGKDRFLPAGEIEAGQTVRIVHRWEWFELILRGKATLQMRRRVFNLHISRWQTFFVVVGNYKIGVHNSKLPGDII